MQELPAIDDADLRALCTRKPLWMQGLLEECDKINKHLKPNRRSKLRTEALNGRAETCQAQLRTIRRARDVPTPTPPASVAEPIPSVQMPRIPHQGRFQLPATQLPAAPISESTSAITDPYAPPLAYAAGGCVHSWIGAQLNAPGFAGAPTEHQSAPACKQIDQVPQYPGMGMAQPALQCYFRMEPRREWLTRTPSKCAARASHCAPAASRKCSCDVCMLSSWCSSLWWKAITVVSKRGGLWRWCSIIRRMLTLHTAPSQPSCTPV